MQMIVGAFVSKCCTKCGKGGTNIEIMKILDECERRLTDEFDILNIMRKLRDSYDLIKKLYQKIT